MSNAEKRLVGAYICSSKLKYKSRKQAWKAALSFYKDFGTLQRPYKCLYCQKFHLTSKHVEKDHLPPEFKQGFNKWFGAQVL